MPADLFFPSLAVLPQQKVALTKPDAEYAEPFTSVRGVRELANGKVLVSDVQDKVVQLIDFAASTTVKVGREGQGPEEYMLPMGLFGMPDGSVVLQDMGNRRFLQILPDGKIGKSFATDAVGAIERVRARHLSRRGPFERSRADAGGNLYFQGMGFPPMEAQPRIRSAS
jgi:hypothetical protein